MKKYISAFLFSSMTILSSSFVFSHCQVPCGIYDDEMRIKMIAEQITTIEKAMKQVAAISKKDESNYNQIVRWVQNKEKHADELSDIVSYYFMAQRLKPVAMKDAEAAERYLKKLTLLHEMLIYAMKAKQTTDTAHVDKLRSLLEDFKVAYFGPKSMDKK